MLRIVQSFIIGIFLFSSVALFGGVYSGGSGTGTSPFQIATVDDFLELSNTPIDWGNVFVLSNDIDLKGLTFGRSPIAPDLSTEGGFQGTSFSGIFDGRGYVISNLTVTASGDTYVSMFGRIADTGQIKNLGIENVNITGNDIVGGLVGYNYGSISHCYFSGVVVGNQWVAGLVGYNMNLISDCYSDCLVYGTNRVGGLVGSGYGGILNSFSLGNVQGIGDWVGGLIGWNNSSIVNCFSSSNVSGNSRVGGLAGYQWNASIINSFSNGAVNGNFWIGGLLGRNHGSSISNCYSSSPVTGTKSIGGLVGINDENGMITYCYSTGVVSGTISVGGLVGYREPNSLTASSFWDTVTSGQISSAGGTGKTTVEMKTLSTFTNANWDFSDTDGDTADWKMPYADYPHLVWEYNLAVTHPNGGERYLTGKTVTIEYASSRDIPTIDIEYSTDNGSSWIFIASGVSNTGSYEWTTPEVDSEYCLVRVSSTGNQTITDSSDDTFIIFRCSQKNPFDINTDCYVNLLDFALFAQNWLWCGDRYNPDCIIN